jgi:hypothetical protein
MPVFSGLQIRCKHCSLASITQEQRSINQRSALFLSEHQSHLHQCSSACARGLGRHMLRGQQCLVRKTPQAVTNEYTNTVRKVAKKGKTQKQVAGLAGATEGAALPPRSRR